MVRPDHLSAADFIPNRPRALELTTPMWIALGLVLLIGLQQMVSTPSSSNELMYLSPDRTTVHRSTEALHQFEQLGIEVEVSEGWTYLSTTQDRLAMSPTFSHPVSGSILRLQPFHLDQWPPENSESQKIDDGDLRMLWVQVGRLLVGRLISGEADLAVVVMDHDNGESVASEILDFCRRVQPLPR